MTFIQLTKEQAKEEVKKLVGKHSSQMIGLIGKSDKELEEECGFDFYLETMHDFFSHKKNTDPIQLIKSFMEFNADTKLKVVRLYDGVIQEIHDMDLIEISKNLLLFGEDKGLFYDGSDDESAICYAFLCDHYFAEMLPGIICFSGKEEYVKGFADILSREGIEYHPPENIADVGKEMAAAHNKLRKLGKNEHCHCGSGKKYKKCCLNRDVKTTGKAMKVDSLWDEGSFIESMSPEEIKEKEETIRLGHDEDMRFSCKQCSAKISAHNKDWHAGMCDTCF